MKKICVFLDNGHGSNTKGKCSPDKSILEYKYCREIAAKLKPALEAEGIVVEMITPEEKDISLTTRVHRVNDLYKKYKDTHHCCLISLHLNAAGCAGEWLKASGWTGWVANNASEKSKKLAQLLYDAAADLGLKGNRWVPAHKYWSANYTILAKTNCPAVLTENLFQDNKNDVKLLLSEEGKNKIIKLHVEGIKKYMEYLS